MSKTVKVVNIILTVAMIMMVLSSNVMATGTSAGSAGSIIDQMQPTYNDGSGIASVGQKIVNIISTVAVVISVIVLLILGIKYMMGSASEKAEYKKTMIPYLVGSVLVFGAGAIAKVVVSMAQSVTTV